MFRVLTILAVCAAVVGAVVLRGRSAPAPAGRAAGCRFPLLEKLAVLVVWLSFVTLAITGFGGATLQGRALHGFWTLIHVTGGAAFAVSLTALLLFRAEAYGFAPPGGSARFATAQKACFWVIATCAVALILSIVLAMLRFVGTDGQHLAVQIHRYSALIALAAAILYAGASARARA